MTLWAVVQSSLEKYLDDIDAAAQLYGANPLAFKDLDNDDDPDGEQRGAQETTAMTAPGRSTLGGAERHGV